MPEKQVFNVQSFLEDNGFDVNEFRPKTGQIIVTSPDQGPMEIKTEDLIDNLQMDRDQIEIVMNRPDTAVDESPVSIGDRVKLAAGNPKGNLKFLLDNFEDASVIKDGFTVLDNGVWKKVDPTFWGNTDDPWKIAKEVSADVAEFIPSFLKGGAETAGALTAGAKAGAAGAALGGPIGAAAGFVGGAIAGGAAAGAASEVVESSFGKVVGTYEATPSEQVSDALFEGLIGGVTGPFAIGVKPGFKAISTAFKRTPKNITNVDKRFLIERANLMGVKETSMARALGVDQVEGRADKIMKVIEPFSKLPREEVERNVRRRMQDELLRQSDVLSRKGLFSQAKQKLSKLFGAAEKRLIKKAGNQRFDMSDIGDKLRLELSQLGLLKKEGGKIVPLKTADIKRALQAQGIDTVSSSKASKSIQNALILANKTNNLRDLSTVQATKLYRNVNDIASKLKIFDAQTGQLKDDLWGGFINDFRLATARKFRAKGSEIGDAFVNMNNVWSQHIDDVSRAAYMANQPGQKTAVQSFIQRLENPATSAEERRFLSQISRIWGERGRQAQDFLEDSVAALDFVPNFSRSGALQRSALSRLKAGLDENLEAILQGQGPSTIRQAGRQIKTAPRKLLRTDLARLSKQTIPESEAANISPFIRAGNTFLKSLPKSQREAFYKNGGFAAVMGNALRSGIDGKNTESFLKEAVNEVANAKPEDLGIEGQQRARDNQNQR